MSVTPQIYFSCNGFGAFAVITSYEANVNILYYAVLPAMSRNPFVSQRKRKVEPTEVTKNLNYLKLESNQRAAPLAQNLGLLLLLVLLLLFHHTNFLTPSA